MLNHIPHAQPFMSTSFQINLSFVSLSMAETQTSKVARLRALVHGRVQGVYFRDFTQTHAQTLGVVGWVRNLSDGMTVEVLAEGPRLAVEQLLAHLRQGPPGVYVAEVDVGWDAPTREFGSFQVR